MEYIIISLLIIAIILLIAILLKKNKSQLTDNTLDKLNKLEISLIKEIGDFKVDFSSSLRKDFDTLDEKLERRVMDMNNKVSERLDESFQRTNRTFNDVLTRLTKIDEAQKKIDGLSTDIISLQSILTDKKTRGIYGEVNLNLILENVFGLSSPIYDLQHKLSNGYIVDCLLYAPSPLGTIAIDSKFPLENYERMINKSLSKDERLYAEKLFKADLKKHIDAIASKYIIPGETASEAILFLPAEAIFAEVNAYYNDIINYAYNKKVWITSPTTLMSTLTIIQMVIKNLERDKYAQIIHEELNKLSIEFSRYKERWDHLARSINTVSKNVEELNTTSEKITKRFDSINRVDISQLSNKGQEKELLPKE